MKAPPKTQLRNFPHPNPKFGRGKKVRHSDAWKKTVYYWWWEYLRRNQDYIDTCDKDGVGKLSALYKDFGDVRSNDFKSWWTCKLPSGYSRGAELFAKFISNDRLKVIQKENIGDVDGNTLLISVPLNQSKKFLIERFRKILARYHQGGRGKRYTQGEDEKMAPYQFRGQPNFQALENALAIYDYALANPKMKSWELGKILPQFQEELKQLKSADVPFGTKRVMAATVSRYKKRALGSIKNVAQGCFP